MTWDKMAACPQNQPCTEHLRLAECEHGGMAEWPIAAVLKTARAQVLEGSNPSPSA